MEQQTFDFTNKLPASAQEAMQRVDDHADEDWKTVIDKCIVAVARRQPELTSDDVLREWEAIPDRPVTRNLAAIGPAMLRAAKDGVLTSTGRVKRSVRTIKHGIRHTIWKSNIYRGAA